MDSADFKLVYMQILLHNCYTRCEDFAFFPLILTRHDAEITFQDFKFSEETMLHRLHLYRANLQRALGNNSSLSNQEQDDAKYYIQRINYILN